MIYDWATIALTPSCPSTYFASILASVMDKFVLQARTKESAVRILKLVEHLPHSVAGKAIGNQSHRRDCPNHKSNIVIHTSIYA